MSQEYRIYTVANLPRFVFIAERSRALTSNELQTAMTEATQLCPKRIVLIRRGDGTWTSLAHQNILMQGNENQAAQAWDRAQAESERKAKPVPRRIAG